VESVAINADEVGHTLHFTRGSGLIAMFGLGPNNKSAGNDRRSARLR
jgi:hypothetical protein